MTRLAALTMAATQSLSFDDPLQQTQEFPVWAVTSRADHKRLLRIPPPSDPQRIEEINWDRQIALFVVLNLEAPCRILPNTKALFLQNLRMSRPDARFPDHGART